MDLVCVKWLMSGPLILGSVPEFVSGFTIVNGSGVSASGGFNTGRLDSFGEWAN